MLRSVLLLLAVSGLHAGPIGAPGGLHELSADSHSPDGFQQGTENFHGLQSVPISFRQGTKLFGRVEVDLDTGLLPESISEQLDGREVQADVPAQKNGGGWVRVEEPSISQLPDGFRQGTEPFMAIPDGFRQGTEPFMSIPEGFRQGTEPFMSIPEGFRQGTEPFMSIPEGFRQGTEPLPSIPDVAGQRTEHVNSISDSPMLKTEPFPFLPDGFRQGTEPFMAIPEGFRQGTEPFMAIPEGFRQGTEPFMAIPEGFRQGTEPFMSIPEGFRQGTEPFMSIPDGFRQGTEPLISIQNDYRQEKGPMKDIQDGLEDYKEGTDSSLQLLEGFREATDPSGSRLQALTVSCKGEVINGKCYEFNPTPLSFREAQDLCGALAPDAVLASVTNDDLHSRLASLVTNGGERSPPLTWLGGMVKNQQAYWIDGSKWSYSDWMPGHPNIHTDMFVCVEMFQIDERWWTAADCELKRASICSYQVVA